LYIFTFEAIKIGNLTIFYMNFYIDDDDFYDPNEGPGQYIYGFEPITAEDPEILILGTMPGVASLNAAEYYAHPKNAFWKIISSVNNKELPSAYEGKKTLLYEMKIALWDVCQICIRNGSLDSEIENEIPNSITKFCLSYPAIKAIIFNGKTAEKLFMKHIGSIANIKTFSAPSTSPAYTLALDKKIEAWKNIFDSIR
jgi:hypoxanthine-DNA glycosylase